MEIGSKSSRTVTPRCEPWKRTPHGEEAQRLEGADGLSFVLTFDKNCTITRCCCKRDADYLLGTVPTAAPPAKSVLDGNGRVRDDRKEEDGCILGRIGRESCLSALLYILTSTSFCLSLFLRCSPGGDAIVQLELWLWHRIASRARPRPATHRRLLLLLVFILSASQFISPKHCCTRLLVLLPPPPPLVLHPASPGNCTPHTDKSPQQ